MGIMPKIETYNYTIRGNKIVMGGGFILYADAYSSHPGNEHCYNLFVNTGSRNNSGLMQAFEVIQGATYFYRNTIITDLIIRSCEAGGPWTITTNVISNPNTAFDDFSASNYISYTNGTSCFTATNNLTNTTASVLVNSADEYKLQPAQAAYVGTRGWQLSDGYTPMELGDNDTPPPTTSRAAGGGTILKNASMY